MRRVTRITSPCAAPPFTSDSDHQSEGDCPILKVPVKRELSPPAPSIINDYDPDIEIKSDGKVIQTPVGRIPEKSKTGRQPETPRKKKKKEKKVFTPEESARILKAMRTKAYGQDKDAVKSYWDEQGHYAHHPYQHENSFGFPTMDTTNTRISS